MFNFSGTKNKSFVETDVGRRYVTYMFQKIGADPVTSLVDGTTFTKIREKGPPPLN